MDIKKYVKTGTNILMYDGSIKPIELIKEGEYVMGPYYNPKKVTAIGCTVGNAVTIIPSKGYPFVCIDTHILTLKGIEPYIYFDKKTKYLKNCRVKYTKHGIVKSKSFEIAEEAQQFLDDLPEDIYYIAVSDYITRTKENKAYCSLFHFGINYPEKEVCMDPYLIGYWLGDGTSSLSEITTNDFEIIDYFQSKLNDYGAKIKDNSKTTYKCYISGKGDNYGKVNNFLFALRTLNLINNKHIPDIYKCNSRKIRLELLAGLVDSDGYVNGPCIEISQKNTTLADDIEYLCYSLGFMISRSESMKSCLYKGIIKNGYYQRMHIYGDNIDEIPTKIKRKKIPARKIKKRATCLRFEVEPFNKSICNGIKVEGEQQYLTSNFLVL
jgi:hypothetical protein